VNPDASSLPTVAHYSTSKIQGIERVLFPAKPPA
jgi:hypothetical protein